MICASLCGQPATTGAAAAQGEPAGAPPSSPAPADAAQAPSTSPAPTDSAEPPPSPRARATAEPSAAPGISPAPASTAPSAPAPDEADRLRRTAAEIQRLLEGALPDEFPVQALFEVDLLDEAAVERRRAELARQLEELQEQIARPSPGAARGILQLRLGVAALRLAFLRLPAAELRRVNEAEERRRLLARHQEEARRAQQAAEEEARQARDSGRRAAQDAALAGSALQQSLAMEKARAESSRASLASLAAELAGARAAEAQRARQRLELALRLEQQARQAADGNEEADRLYDEVVSALRVARPALRSALSEYRAPSRVPRFEVRLRLDDIADPRAAEEVARLRALHEDLRWRAEELREQEESVRWQAQSLRAEEVARLNAVRLALLPGLSPSKRSRVLGVTRQGIDQLVREVEDLGLMARFHTAARLREADRIPSLLRDVFTVGAAAYTVLKLGLIVFLALLLARRGPSLLEAGRRSLLRRPWSRRLARILRPATEVLHAVWPQAVFLAALLAARASLGEAARWPELEIAYVILLWYGAYRLAVQGLHAMAMRLSGRYLGAIGEPTRRRVLLSIRTLARVVLSIGIVLALSERFLGRGHLFGTVLEFGWVAIVAALLVLLQQWRREICDAYLRVSPEGRLARLVRDTRESWQGFKALAFVLRKRIERQAERGGHASEGVSSLPPQVREAFSEEPLQDGELEIDHYPGLDRLLAALERGAGSGTGGSFLLVGERGHGKTSWLNRAMREPALRGAARADLVDRILDPWELMAALGKAIGGQQGPGGDLDRVLLEGPRRIIVVDQCHNLMLRSVGGYAALETLFNLLEVTQRRVFWICAFNHHAWMHAAALWGANHPFRDLQTLPAWDADAIWTLIRRRTQRSGLSLSYEDLLVEDLEGVSDRTRITETEQGYTRLLWDYSDGNPRVAVHYWIRSLVPDGAGAARVRLFEAPDVSALEKLSDVERFLLAAVMSHENLTAQEAARTTRYPLLTCEGALERLREPGILRSDRGRFRVTTYWHPALVRFLKRKNMLAG